MEVKPIVLIINGPNLNLVGKREPEIYGNQSMDSYIHDLILKYKEIDLEYYQTNHEGSIIDKLHEVGFTYDGIILNAGGYTHTSIAIADAVKAIHTPVIEVHLSDIHQREAYRNHSYLTPVCKHFIAGKGLQGYELALRHLVPQYST